MPSGLLFLLCAGLKAGLNSLASTPASHLKGMCGLLRAGYFGPVFETTVARNLLGLLGCLAIALVAPSGLRGAEADASGFEQIAIPRVEQMPNIPSPFRMRDWNQVARDFDAYVFDLRAKGNFLPLTWIDRSHVNFPEDAFGIYVTVADPRCGPKNNQGAYHDAICDLPAVIGATLVGIDKRHQHGRNWVRMCKAYFNKANGRDVFMQYPQEYDYRQFGGGYLIDFWQTVLPNVFFAQLASLYPEEPQFADIQRTCADQFCEATKILMSSGRGFHWSSFDFKTMQPVKNMIPEQPDVAAGFAWLEYMAYIRFKDSRYLEAAEKAMRFLNAETNNPLYAVTLPMGPYISARMQAELGHGYDTAKMVNWCFAGGTKCVGGVLAGRWGNYDVSGLVTMYDWRPYLMETFQYSASLVPMVRYDQRFARAIGKWMLNAANAARLFYPEEIPDEMQATPEYKAFSRNLLAYEVLIPADRLEPEKRKTTGIPFLADRDSWGDSYHPVSHLSVYSSTPVGIFGGMISKTDDEKILRLDLLKTDFFHGKACPSYLYYNPYQELKTISVDVGRRPVDIYETTTHSFLQSNVRGKVPLTLRADAASVIVVVPSGGKKKTEGGKLFVNGIVVDWRASDK